MVQVQGVMRAEQAATSRYWSAESALEREIRMTVRLQVPEEDGVGVGISAGFEPALPPPWEDVLHQRLNVGVHGGLATVGTALPDGGVGVRITRLVVIPPIEAGSDADEIRRLGDTLEALAAATVASLWIGLRSLNEPLAARGGLIA